MPGPVSATAIRTSPSRSPAESVTLAPREAYLMALSMRLERIFERAPIGGQHEIGGTRAPDERHLFAPRRQRIKADHVIDELAGVDWRSLQVELLRLDAA